MTNSGTILDVPKRTLFSEKLARAIDHRWRGSRADLAQEVGVSRASLNQYLSGSTPKPHTIYLLASKLSVSLPWLLNEDDATLEPQNTAVSVDELPVLEFVVEGERRYVHYAIDLHMLLLRLARGDVPWARIALWVLKKHDPTDPPTGVARGLDLVRSLDELSFYVKRLRSLCGPNQIALTLQKLRPPGDVKAEDLDADKLLERVDALEKAYPSIDAINDYLTVVHNKNDSRNPKALMDWFGPNRAPFHLARIIDDPAIKDYPQRKQLRKELIETGYLSKDGVPHAFPELQIPDIPMKK